MRAFFICLIFLGGTPLLGQSQSLSVQQTIERFFAGFHEQDSTKMKESLSTHLILQTIVTDSTGNASIRSERPSDFLKAIASIPASVHFQEKLLSFHVQEDGAMAHAWTPYEFWIDDKFRHCGVNSFQLLKEQGGWKIIYLIDTRRKEGCN
jgi:hypothetical protein